MDYVLGEEHLLSISALDYAAITGVDLTSYNCVGVVCSDKRLYESVPEGTEVVVGYHVSETIEGYSEWGTALVPKDYEPSDQTEKL